MRNLKDYERRGVEAGIVCNPAGWEAKYREMCLSLGDTPNEQAISYAAFLKGKLQGKVARYVKATWYGEWQRKGN